MQLRFGPDDVEALTERMEAFNSLPFEERRAHTDAPFAARVPDPVELLFTYAGSPTGSSSPAGRVK